MNDNLKNKKTIAGIIAIVIMAGVVTFLAIMLIRGDEVKKPPASSTIPEPVYSDKTSYEEGVYSYVILDNGSAMIINCRLKNDVTVIDVPSELGGKKVSAIGDSVFELMTWVTSANIPEGIEYIGVRAFSSCGLDTVSLPSTLKYIQNDAFAYCSYLQYVSYNGSISDWTSVTVGTGNAYLVRNLELEVRS